MTEDERVQHAMLLAAAPADDEHIMREYLRQCRGRVRAAVERYWDFMMVAPEARRP